MKLFNLGFLFFLTVFYSCAGNNRVGSVAHSNIEGSNIKDANIKYAKENGSEYLFITGENLDSYNLVSKKQGLELNIEGYDVSLLDRAELVKKSNMIKNASSYITSDGSKLYLDLKNNPGFKIYKRDNGLAIAMGGDYKTVSKEDLSKLERDLSETIQIERELDRLLNPMTDDEKLDLDASISNEELGNIVNNLTSDVDDLEWTEEELNSLLEKEEESKNVSSVESDFIEQDDFDSVSDSVVAIMSVRFIRGINSNRFIIQGNRAIQYLKNKKYSNNKRVVFDIYNAYLPNKIKTMLSNFVPTGIVKRIMAKQISETYKLVRFFLYLRSPIDLDMNGNGNISYVKIPNGTWGKNKRRIGSNAKARSMLSRMSFEDYLARPREYFGTKISIEVNSVNIIDVFKLIKRVSGIKNIVVSEKINNRVSASLYNVPWDQVLSVVLQNAQLGYVRHGDILRIAPLADLLDERRMAAGAVFATKELEPLELLVYNAYYANYKVLRNKISVLLSKRGKMTIGSDKVLVVNDRSDVLSKVRLFLETYKDFKLGRKRGR